MKSLIEYISESKYNELSDLLKKVSEFNNLGQVATTQQAQKIIESIISDFKQNGALEGDKPSKSESETWLAYNDKAAVVFKWKDFNKCFVCWSVYENPFYKDMYRAEGSIYYSEKELFEDRFEWIENKLGKLNYMVGESDYFNSVK